MGFDPYWYQVKRQSQPLDDTRPEPGSRGCNIRRKGSFSPAAIYILPETELSLWQDFDTQLLVVSI
ncbi:hypothetical protein AALP_AA1G080500 [Arabis alpina]|uniref:Uncharacterized protein n=1 Tax=Arabis alpina TaxID=50452 RepID=A0A087HLV1_ARAAL|nr:hypothetical protein AALP_AA1G080500 [Arabis alpina]